MAGNQERRDIDGVGARSGKCSTIVVTPLTHISGSINADETSVETTGDLSGKFMDDYEVDQERSDVARYGHYFLGSIILSQRTGWATSLTASNV